MTNLANYSPYNKTYKFILFQNQAYHQKAKRNSRPVIRTNLRYTGPSEEKLRAMSSQHQLNSSFVNPENPNIFKNMSEQYSEECPSPIPIRSPKTRSMMISNFDKISPIKLQQRAYIQKQKRVIHKNQSFQKFKNKEISKQNKDLVQRLLGTSCEVIRNKKSSESFRNHLRYREIRKVYKEGGNRKHPLSMGNSSLLCPTLAEFNMSGLGPKFLEKDLSFCSARSVTASRLNSPRKSQASFSQMRRSQL